MKLYDYFRSTACWRVRIVLALKGIDTDKTLVHLIDDGGHQHRLEYQTINPQKLVPSLILDDGTVLTQSLSIAEYINECHKEPPLLPDDALGRARVRQMAQIIASDIHPLNNLRVLNRLREQFHADEPAISAWYHHWLKEGFDALESLVNDKEPYCYGNRVTLADVALIPQIFNAKRFEFDLKPYHKLLAINNHCMNIQAFKDTAP